MPDLLTTSQVRDLLNIDRTTIYRMVEDGRLPAIRVGKQWRFPRGEIERWLRDQAVSAPTVASAAAPIAPEPAPAGRGIAELLPMGCTQLIQDAFAEMLGVIMLIADMRGRPVTPISNPHAYFSALSAGNAGAQGCLQNWHRLAETLALEPRFTPWECGLLWTRGLIRVGSELKGIVIAGGIAPENWPPTDSDLEGIARSLGADPTQVMASTGSVYRLGEADRARVLRWVQRIADIFAHMAQDRSALCGRLQAIASLTILEDLSSAGV